MGDRLLSLTFDVSFVFGIRVEHSGLKLENCAITIVSDYFRFTPQAPSKQNYSKNVDFSLRKNTVRVRLP